MENKTDIKKVNIKFNLQYTCAILVLINYFLIKSNNFSILSSITHGIIVVMVTIIFLISVIMFFLMNRIIKLNNLKPNNNNIERNLLSIILSALTTSVIAAYFLLDITTNNMFNISLGIIHIFSVILSISTMRKILLYKKQ